MYDKETEKIAQELGSTITTLSNIIVWYDKCNKSLPGLEAQIKQQKTKYLECQQCLTQAQILMNRLKVELRYAVTNEKSYKTRSLMQDIEKHIRRAEVVQSQADEEFAFNKEDAEELLREYNKDVCNMENKYISSVMHVLISGFVGMATKYTAGLAFTTGIVLSVVVFAVIYFILYECFSPRRVEAGCKLNDIQLLIKEHERIRRQLTCNIENLKDAFRDSVQYNRHQCQIM